MGPQLNSECQLMWQLKIKRCLSLFQLRLSKYPKCHELPQGLILLSCDMCSNRAIEKFFYHLTCEATVLFRSKIYSPSLCLSQASLICLQINSTSTKIPHVPTHLSSSHRAIWWHSRLWWQELKPSKKETFSPLPLPPQLSPAPTPIFRTVSG